MMIDKTLLVFLLIVPVIFNMGVIFHGDLLAKSKDSKAKADFIKKAGKAVEGKWSKIEIGNMSLFGSNSTITFYNKTKASPGPVVPPPPPTPNPTPTGNISVVCAVGDLSGSTVPNKMKGCDMKIGIGDLGYGKDLSYFKKLGFDKCVIGNHDSPEDGTQGIYKEALTYCGEFWSLKVGKSTLLLGFNTNGNLDTQLGKAQDVITSMNGIKSVVILSHKPCYTSPNSHHPVESSVKTLCDSLAQSIPQGVKIYYVSGHNHQMASTTDGLKFVSGAGGRSHYDCGTNTLWNFCDNKNYGYLEMKIDNNNGNIGTQFIK